MTQASWVPNDYLENNANYAITAITPPAACIANKVHKACQQGIKASLFFSFPYLKSDARVLSSHMLIFF